MDRLFKSANNLSNLKNPFARDRRETMSKADEQE